MINGFRIGSDENGGNQAKSAFDELMTFESPLVGVPEPAETLWWGVPDYKADPNGLLAAWQMKYFGYFGLDPNGDYDGDGTNNLQKYLNGTDPNIVTFSVLFPYQYVSTSVVTGLINVSGGVPSYCAVLVDSTNFASATWSNYSPNLTVDLGSTDGPHDVWIGLRGLPPDAQQTWIDTTLILNSVMPAITITDPADDTSFNATRINASGNFTSAALDQITVNGVLAFVSGTNYEALNVPLDAGTNTITATIEDLTGATNAISITVIGLTNSDGSMNDPVQLQATPIVGFAPLSVTFSAQASSVPGTIQQVSYDFTGDGITDFVTNNLDSLTFTYGNGQYFPVVTIQTTAGTFSSSGGWNSYDTNRLQITVHSAPAQTTLASVTDPVDLKWTGTNLYVLSGSSGTVIEFATNGTSVGSPLDVGAACSGFDVDGAGNIYVAVTASNQVWKFILTNSSYLADPNFGNGGFIGDPTGATGTTSGLFNAPYDVAVSPDGGAISVSDSGNNQIQQFSANDGSFSASIGSEGGDVGQFNAPEGLTYDSSGTLYIVDSGNNRIVLMQGTSVEAATGSGGTALAQLAGPVNISVGQRAIYVADTGNNRIQSFSTPVADNLFSIDSSSIRFALAGFNQPAAVAAVDSLTNELFYIADTGNNRVILCNEPNADLDAIQAVWNEMTNRIAAGDISGAVSDFSDDSRDDYQQAFLGLGVDAITSDIGQIGNLTPVFIYDDTAEYYFDQDVEGNTIIFPVKFVKENGVWKIQSF